MKSCFLLALLWLAVFTRTAASGADWYVATSGSDEAPGTLEQPFASVQRAQKSVQAGDTVYLRGGTYRMAESQIAWRRGIFASLIVLDKSGTADAPITYTAYQEEEPVFDCSQVRPEGQRVTAFLVSGSWLRVRGITVTGVQVTMRGHTQSICFESQGSHNVLEQLRLHDSQAIGIYHVRGSDNLFLNCDAWNNWDYTSEDGKGGNADGFGCHPPKGSTGNIFRGCRAWFNSDDGYDCLGAQEPVVFEDCWAAYSGWNAKWERLADGNGFKAGGYGSRPANELPSPIPRHVVRGCLAIGNRSSGFYANHHPGGCDWIGNMAYRNGSNFNMLGRLLDNRTDVPGTGHKLVGNVSYGSKRDLVMIEEGRCELRGNSWTSGKKLAAADFASLDEAEFFQPREKDGSLPKIAPMKRLPKP